MDSVNSNTHPFPIPKPGEVICDRNSLVLYNLDGTGPGYIAQIPNNEPLMVLTTDHIAPATCLVKVITKQGFVGWIFFQYLWEGGKHV